MRPLTALGLFTVIPVPPRDIDARAAAGAMAALPLTGLILGALAGACVWLGATIGAPVVGAIGGLALLAGLTGGLHLDGVADTADGLGSRKPADEALAIMKRSDIGPMGVIALVLVLLLQAAALLDVATALAPWAAGCVVAVAAAAGRTAVLFASRGPSARPGGFGALLSGVPSTPIVALNVAAVLALSTGLGWAVRGTFGVLGFVAAAGAALLVGGAWGARVRRRLGGTTGDVFGSIAEVTQTAALVAFAVAAHLLS